MKVAVVCEFSQVVTKAFIDRGHIAKSYDFSPALWDKQHHRQGDIQNLPRNHWDQYDLLIAHPDCTYLCSSGERWMKDNPERQAKRIQAVNFVLWLADLPVPRIAIENPIGKLSSIWRKPDQIIQPWMFGQGETKAHCLWLKNLPRLMPTDIVDGRTPRIHYESPQVKNGLTRGQRRSITYLGIAEAMAAQWGRLVCNSPYDPEGIKAAIRAQLIDQSIKGL